MFYVVFNAKVMGAYKSIKCALNLVRRKSWQDDADNCLYIVDNKGNMYNPLTGKEL